MKITKKWIFIIIEILLMISSAVLSVSIWQYHLLILNIVASYFLSYGILAFYKDLKRIFYD